VQIDICICTFRRPSIIGTLESIAGQVLPDGVSLRIIVVDNDTVPSARDSVEQSARDLGLVLLYRHAPARNISIARNACLDAADAPLVAFIDDDERATPNWIAQLLARFRHGGCDVVFGPVKPAYRDTAPAWMKTAEMHAIRPVVRAGGAIDTGYTSNVMIRTAAIAQHRFDLRLGRCGGEDTVFFNQLYHSGAVLVFNQDAIVTEDVPEARTSLGWMLRRAFRSGQSHARMQAGGYVRRLAATVLASAKFTACMGLAVSLLPSPAKWRKQVVRGALHAGVVAKLLGARDLELY
jgi:succinoglycan biosynthesis protein ExoM